jgi:hypothetical protein
MVPTALSIMFASRYRLDNLSRWPVLQDAEKSSLLNLIAGLLRPAAGMVCSAGRALESINRNAAYVIQSDALLP